MTKDKQRLEEVRPFYDDPPRGADQTFDSRPRALRGRIPHVDSPGVFRGARRRRLPADLARAARPPCHRSDGIGPVVTTSVGGIAYLVRDHKTALVVELGDAGQLAAALIELLADPERRETLSATGRAHVERRFAWNTRVDDWLALYERALR